MCRGLPRKSRNAKKSKFEFFFKQIKIFKKIIFLKIFKNF